MIIAVTGVRQPRRVVTDLIDAIDAIEATPLDQLLTSNGFVLQPFRVPRGLERGNLRLRLTWKKTAGAEVETVRLTHVVTVPDRR